LELNANYIIIQERPKHIRNSSKLIVNSIAKVPYRARKITTKLNFFVVPFRNFRIADPLEFNFTSREIDNIIGRTFKENFPFRLSLPFRGSSIPRDQARFK